MRLFHVQLDRAGGEDILSSPLREAYGSTLSFPSAPPSRPYVFTNFVTTMDARVTFGVPGRPEGRLISMKSRDDQWLMGLLRGAADAVMVGAGTLRADADHTWTVRALKNADADAVEQWRLDRGAALHPLQVFVTASGMLDTSAAVFQREDLQKLIFTTHRGAEALSGQRSPQTHVVPLEAAGSVHLQAALSHLREHWNVRMLLCEGGPRLYFEMLQEALIDECFQTISPQIAGAGGEGRYSLTEGRGWMPEHTPRFHLISIRTGMREPDHLFLRYRRIES